MHIIEYDGHKVFRYGSHSSVVFLPVPSAVTIGSYDGVHKGHRVIISRMVSQAEHNHLRSVVVTFEPHPRRVLNPSSDMLPGLLTTLDEKIDLLSCERVDLLFVIRFTAAFAARSSEDFIRMVLVKLLGARNVIVGYDHAFGHDRQGSRQTLMALRSELGYAVDVVDEVLIDDEHFSSTRIRHLLAEGNIEQANVFLGSPYMISGHVVEGARLGRTIGFPTVNLELSDCNKLLPRSGVYQAQTMVNGLYYMAMMNIGVRPTVSTSGQTTIEAHLLGFNGNLYGRFLRFHLMKFIREERKFSSVGELQQQLEKDRKAVEFY